MRTLIVGSSEALLGCAVVTSELDVSFLNGSMLVLREGRRRHLLALVAFLWLDAVGHLLHDVHEVTVTE